MLLDVVKVITPLTIAFALGIALTPLLTHYLYAFKAWKKSPQKIALDGSQAVEFGKLRDDVETKTPRMGGIVIWGSVFVTSGFLWLLSYLIEDLAADTLGFISRDQTWIPLTALMIGAIVGLLNDIRDISPTGEQGISLTTRLLIVAILSGAIAMWFYQKLEVTALGVPFGSDIELGILIIPFFILVSLAIYASGVIDGIDGLSGGVFASIFAAYAGIAFAQNQIDLAAFCATVVGALLAFLWFNIPPARFWMTETGTMGLTFTLAVVAFMTDSLGDGEGLFVLPIIGFLLVATVASNILQVFGKKFFGVRVFKVAPLHHHFEALGWPGYKVVMRYWVLSIMFAFVGVLVALIG